MALFNAVLLPAVDFRDRIVDYAQEHYAEISEGFCLSPTVYPHITLCQFEMDDQPMIFIDGLFNPVFETEKVRNGAGIHEGYQWIEWTVKKEDWLSELQETVHGALTQENALVTTAKGEEYQPHMTFCRLPKKDANSVDLPVIEQSNKPWIFTIGSSDRNGQFIG
ncbi:MAG: hypothetical protein AAF569_00950 [Pseudomonadota bacterium]